MHIEFVITLTFDAYAQPLVVFCVVDLFSGIVRISFKKLRLQLKNARCRKLLQNIEYKS